MQGQNEAGGSMARCPAALLNVWFGGAAFSKQQGDGTKGKRSGT